MRRTVAVLVTVVVLLGSACVASGSKTKVTIGALYPTSGAQGSGGTDEERGVRLAVEWANAHGGVGGRPVRLRSVDAPRAENVPEAMGALRSDGVTVVLGSHGSPISAAPP